MSNPYNSAYFAPNQLVRFPEYATPSPNEATATVTAKSSGEQLVLKKLIY